MTNLCIRWNTSTIISDGMKEVKAINVYFYTPTGEVLKLPISNILGCWIRLDGDYSIKVRKKVDTSTGELFAVKTKDAGGYYDLYIPFLAAGGHTLDNEVINVGDYNHTFQTYQVNGYNLVKFTEGGIDLSEVDKETLKVYLRISHERTKERKKLDKLAEEIYKECNVSLSVYALKDILKKYRIVKRKKVE